MESNEEQCRICLKNEVFFDWTEAIFEFTGPSYRECYFQYTHLQEEDEDANLCTQMFCLDCGNGLRNTYKLVEQALASYKKLQELQSKVNSQADETKEYVIEEIDLTDTEEFLNTNSEEQDLQMDISENVDNIEITSSYINSTEIVEVISECESENSTISIVQDGKEKKTRKRKKEPLMCVYCSRIFYAREHLIKHEKTHDENRERKEVCSICGLKFYDKVALRVHEQIHEENRVREKKCEFCPKAFFNTGALNVHRRIHLGQMIKCNFCPKEYCRQVDLNRHMKSHNLTSVEGDRNLQRRNKFFMDCNMCGKKIERLSWNTHKARHLKQPVVECNICSKSYYGRSGLVRHLKKEHGISGQYEEHITKLNKKFKPRLSSLMKQQNVIID